MDDLSKSQMFVIHGVAAVGSVAFASALTYPLDTMKVLTQVASSSGKQLNAAELLLRILTLSGNSGLFSGYGSLALGRTLGLGARFGVYEIITAFYKASVAAAASHAFDTTRTRSQCTVLPKYVSMERRLLKWKQPGNKFERYTGIHPSDRNLLFRGLRWRMARSGLASFMIVGSYFFAVDHLASNLT